MSTTLTEATFDEEIAGSSEPVLVDCLGGSGAGPCKMIGGRSSTRSASSRPASSGSPSSTSTDHPDIARRFDVMRHPDAHPSSKTVSRPSAWSGRRARDSSLQELERVPRLTVEVGSGQRWTQHRGQRSPPSATVLHNLCGKVVDNINLVLTPQTPDPAPRASVHNHVERAVWAGSDRVRCDRGTEVIAR